MLLVCTGGKSPPCRKRRDKRGTRDSDCGMEIKNGWKGRPPATRPAARGGGRPARHVRLGVHETLLEDREWRAGLERAVAGDGSAVGAGVVHQRSGKPAAPDTGLEAGLRGRTSAGV